MLNWIKNLFTSSPAPVAEAPYKLEIPVVEEPVVETLVTKTPLTPQAVWPFPTDIGMIAVEGMGVIRVAKPKTADVKKAAPKSASKKSSDKTCNFNKLTKAQLLAEAKHRNVKTTVSMSKTDILAAVKAAK
mgnify:CR=1 FL=1|tara:strand:- start:53 stop:445 length:393 start_codon:yes stop_codon:yes gene_type:complete